jgi:hypothetical protein
MSSRQTLHSWGTLLEYLLFKILEHRSELQMQQPNSGILLQRESFDSMWLILCDLIGWRQLSHALSLIDMFFAGSAQNSNSLGEITPFRKKMHVPVYFFPSNNEKDEPTKRSRRSIPISRLDHLNSPTLENQETGLLYVQTLPSANYCTCDQVAQEIDQQKDESIMLCMHLLAAHLIEAII